MRRLETGTRTVGTNASISISEDSGQSSNTVSLEDVLINELNPAGTESNEATSFTADAVGVHLTFETEEYHSHAIDNNHQNVYSIVPDHLRNQISDCFRNFADDVEIKGLIEVNVLYFYYF